MENQEDEFTRWLRFQLERARLLRDSLLDEAQQMDVVVEALELLMSDGPHHGEP